jgi:hypothetical protein
MIILMMERTLIRMKRMGIGWRIRRRCWRLLLRLLGFSDGMELGKDGKRKRKGKGGL